MVVAVYWRMYGQANFLWFSDIAFFGMAYAMWRDDSLFTGMMAIGVLPLEFIWAFSYLSGFVGSYGRHGLAWATICLIPACRIGCGPCRGFISR